jgi:glycosyltransferase involved in cell wall biosynthesis
MSKQLTIVICTFNRAKLLKNCLESVLAQTADPSTYDVIVVNNMCTDNTSEVVAQFAAKQSNIREVIETEVGLSAARNRGYKEAQTEYVAYTDDDAKLSPNWVEVAYQTIQEHKPDIFGGPVFPYYEKEKPAWYEDKYGYYSVYNFNGWMKSGDEIFLSGANIIFKRTVLGEYQGFDTKYGMKGGAIGYHEETEIQKRAKKENKALYYNDKLVVYHVVAELKHNILFNIYTSYKSGKDGFAVWHSPYNFDDYIQLIDHLDYVFNELGAAMLQRDKDKYPYPENYVMEKLKPAFEEIGRRVGYFSNPDNVRTTEMIRYIARHKLRKARSFLGRLKRKLGL